MNPYTPYTLNRTVILGSRDIIQQTRNLAEAVKITLRHLAVDPISAAVVNRIIEDENNNDIENMNSIGHITLEEAIWGVETGAQMVERAEEDILMLIAKVETIITLTDPAQVVTIIRHIICILEPLVDNNNYVVISQLMPLRSVAVLLDTLATTAQLDLAQAERAQMQEVASIMTAVTTFLTQLRAVVSKFQNIYTLDNKDDSFNAIGNLMQHLGDLFTSLGSVITGECIRRGREFIQKIVQMSLTFQ